MGSGEIVTYPCEGTTGVFPGVHGEYPNPIPRRDLATSPIGPGVLIRGRFFSDMVLTSFSLRKTSTGAPVAIAAPLARTNEPVCRFRFCDVDSGHHPQRQHTLHGERQRHVEWCCFQQDIHDYYRGLLSMERLYRYTELNVFVVRQRRSAFTLFIQLNARIFM